MSNNGLKKMRSLDEIYAGGVKTLKNGLIICSVCEKSYKSELAAKKHVDKRDCHTMHQIIEGTPHEDKAFNLYKIIVANLNRDASVSMATFRKSPFYGPVSRFTIFCTVHKVFSSDVYMAWLNEVKGIQNVNAILSAGLDETNLREFRIYLQVMNLIPSEKFYERYRDDLLTDDQFLTRSIEQSRIGLRWLAEREDFPFEERMDSLPIDYQERLSKFADEILS